MGELTDKAKGLGNEIAGNAKQMTADITDDHSLHQEGEAQERKGEAQNLSGEIKAISATRSDPSPAIRQGPSERAALFTWVPFSHLPQGVTVNEQA